MLTVPDSLPRRAEGGTLPVSIRPPAHGGGGVETQLPHSLRPLSPGVAAPLAVPPHTHFWDCPFFKGTFQTGRRGGGCGWGAEEMPPGLSSFARNCPFLLLGGPQADKSQAVPAGWPGSGAVRGKHCGGTGPASVRPAPSTESWGPSPPPDPHPACPAFLTATLLCRGLGKVWCPSGYWA